MHEETREAGQGGGHVPPRGSAPESQPLAEHWGGADPGDVGGGRVEFTIEARPIPLLARLVILCVLIIGAVVAIVVFLPLAIVFVAIALLIGIIVLARVWLARKIAVWRDPGRRRRGVTVRERANSE